MKNLSIFLIIITCLTTCLFSCTDQDEFINPDSSVEPSLKYGGDGKYDLLGHGCDATNDFFSGKFRVIDNDKLYALASFAINTDETQQRREELIGNYTAEKYLKKVTKSKGIDLGVGDKDSEYGLGFAGLTKKFTSTESYSIENSFASVKKFILKKSFSYTIDPDYILELDCLSPEFKYALSKYDPAKIISMYGTHVYTNVKLGGSLELYYRAKVTKTEKDKTKTTEAGAAGAFKSIFNADVKYSKEEQEKAIKETDDYSFVAIAKGGNVSIPLSKQEIKDVKVVQVIDTYEWEKSIGENDGKGNVFIDFEPGSLIPLWEFVKDTNLKESLKAAITKYIEENQYKDPIPEPVPFYQHFFNNGKVLDHYYSTNPISPTFYGNQGAVCNIYKVQKEGTVPLYHFYSSIIYDHYYSTFQGTPSRYNYVDIAGYIYPEEEEGTVPLYSYWVSDYKRFDNHYYTLSPNAPNLYSRKTIVGYVYPPKK